MNITIYGWSIKECRSLLPDEIGDRHPLIPAIPTERLEELREGMEEFADCLREQGVDVEASEDGPFRHLRFHHDADDEEAEAFREAVEACGGTLPRHLDGLPGADKLPARFDA